MASTKTRFPNMPLLAAAIVLSLAAGVEPARASPANPGAISKPAPLAEPAQIYQKGRTPIYPYIYRPGYPGGWGFYFGFVPYTKGNIENEAVERGFRPQHTWPHDPRAQPPNPYGVPAPYAY